MEKFETLESQKEALLDAAAECFTAANIAWEVSDPNEHDERWLHHYMLGKIAEKKKQEPSVYLDHYSKAGKLLFENKATYPIKINYSNPQHLSMEALEIHYRIHASILKYLELHEGKPLSRFVGKIFQKYLKESDNGLFSSPLRKSDNSKVTEIGEKCEIGTKRPLSDAEVPILKRRRLSELTVFEDVANTVEDILKIVETDFKEIKTEVSDDVVMIIDSDSDEDLKNKRIEAYKALSKSSINVNISAITSQSEVRSGVSTPSTDSDNSKVGKIRVRSAQDIMDDMMKKCMANQPEYKSETETDIEIDGDKNKDMKHNGSENNNQKQTELVSSPSRRGSTTSTAATTTTSSTSDSSDSSSSDDSSDSSSSSDSDSSETESSKQSNNSKKKANDSPMSSDEIKKLIDQCLYSLEQCISRFPQNYKAIYRLTHFYFHNKSYRDLSKCKKLMLSEYRCSDTSVITGLFSERKNNNFFYGVWRIPTSEIDRPGSFASHMSRCVQLLMQVLRETDDHKILLDLCVQLKRTPEPDKIYIKDGERKQLSDQAFSLCTQSLRGMLKRMLAGQKIYNETETQPGQENDPNIRLVLDIFRAHQKIQKHLPNKESIFSGLLVDAYKHYMQNKLPEKANVADLAVKFCIQRKAANRVPAVHIETVPTKPSPPTDTTTQVPVPTSPSVQPVRKPNKGLPGRPRGRPPNINKHLTGVKPKTTKDHSFLSPNNPYAWQNLLYSQAMGANIDPNAALNYMMSKYQEEILRQYSHISGPKQGMNTNPFGVNNPLIPPNVLSTSSFTTPVTSSISTSKIVAPVPSTSKLTTTEIIKHKPASERKEPGETKARYSKETNKAYYEPTKEYPGSISIFKDRPGISITPIHQTTQPMPAAKPPMPPSPGKTLQQKLAERQKQNPAAQHKSPTKLKHDSSVEIMNQLQSFTQKNISYSKPIVQNPTSQSTRVPSTYSKGQNINYSNLQKSIPSSLTITKSHPQNIAIHNLHPADSGISISQVSLPGSSMMFNNKPEASKLMNFRKPSIPKMKPGTRKLGDITVTPNYNKPSNESKIEFPPNIPISLSVIKKDLGNKNEPKKDEGLEIITIE